jgi:hypothetical protein
MKFKVDNEEVLELTTAQKKVLKHYIKNADFTEDMKRRVAYIITHKLDQCNKQLRTEWEPKLKAKGVTSVPLDNDAFAELVFTQSDYPVDE